MKTVNIAAIICDDKKEKNNDIRNGERLWRFESGWDFQEEKGVGRTPQQALIRENHRRTGYGNQGRRTD